MYIMKDDTIQLAAYALIIIIIGLSSVIKKVLEARRKRRILEAQQQKQNKSITAEDSGGLRSGDEASTPSEQKEIPYREMEPAPAPQPMAETEGHEAIDLEKVLRRALGLPAAEDIEKKERERKLAEIRQQQIKIISHQSVKEITTPAQSGTSEPGIISGPEMGTYQQTNNFVDDVASGWSDFVNDLDTNESSELARAIILSEVIAPPIVLRRHNILRSRLI